MIFGLCDTGKCIACSAETSSGGDGYSVGLCV